MQPVVTRMPASDTGSEAASAGAGVWFFFGLQDRREARPQRCEQAIVKPKVGHALADIDVTDSLAKRYSSLIGDAISGESQPMQRMFPERCDQQIAIPPGVTS